MKIFYKITFVFFYLIISLQVKAEEVGQKGLPQLDLTTWPTQIFWLIISFTSFFIIIRFLITPKIKNVIDNRSLQIESDIEQSKKINAKIINIREEYDKSILEAKEKALQQTKDAINFANVEIEKKELEISKKIENKFKNHEKQLLNEKLKIKQNLEKLVIDTTISTVSKITDINLKKDELSNHVNKRVKSL